VRLRGLLWVCRAVRVLKPCDCALLPAVEGRGRGQGEGLGISAIMVWSGVVWCPSYPQSAPVALLRVVAPCSAWPVR
jgi:hypothetical protein